MALRQIRQYGDDILQKKAKPVQVFDSVLHRLIDDMWETCLEYDGLGMAAPQIGMLRQIIVIEMEEEKFKHELINPKIVKSSGSDVKTEACLSVPDKQGDVVRPMYVKIEAVDRYGEPYTVEARDMLAAALCHEIDHLNGILFLDVATKISDRVDDEDDRRSRRNRRNKNKQNKNAPKGGKKDTKKQNPKIQGGKQAAGR
ncbi:MAG: peptide deformylase [Defluviitaleaceae bacterium]|nr:peptide deformylase [Defluviitaleaceae bacterium]